MRIVERTLEGPHGLRIGRWANALRSLIVVPAPDFLMYASPY